MPWIPRSMWRWRPGAMCSVSRYRTESQRSNRATAVLSENERHFPDSGDIGIQRNEIARKGKRQVAAFEQSCSRCSSECDSVVINTAQYTIRSPAVAGSGAASGGGRHERPPRPGVGSPRPINRMGIPLHVVIVALPHVLQNIPHLVHPAALMQHPRMNRRDRRR